MGTWRGVACVIGVILLAPTVALFLSLFSPLSAEQAESWAHVRNHQINPAVKDTCILGVGAIIGALVLGVPPAWVLSRKSFKGRSLLGAFLVLPLAIPAYIFSFLITDIREALIPWLITVRERHGVDQYLLAEEWSRYLMLILIFSAVLYPYVFLAARSAFSGNLRGLSEASLGLQRSPWETFWKVQFPLARPAIVTSLFFVFMEVLNDYGAVKHFGFSTFTVTLFRTWFGLGELEIAQRLSCWILAGVLLVMWLEHLQRGRRSYKQERGQGKAPALPLNPLEIMVVSVPLLLGLVLPLYLLGRWMVVSAETIDPDLWGEMGGALLNSLLLGLIVVAVTVISALVIVGVVRYTRFKGAHLVKNILHIVGYASPGVIMAIGVLSIVQPLRDSALFPSFNQLTSATILLLAFALVCRYYAVASQMVNQALERLPHAYDEASQALGWSTLTGFFRTITPLLSPALLGGAALVFVDVTKELPLSLLLRPFDFETLGTYTYGFVDQGQLYHCAFPSALLILLCMVGLFLVESRGWRNH